MAGSVSCAGWLVGKFTFVHLVQSVALNFVASQPENSTLRDTLRNIGFRFTGFWFTELSKENTLNLHLNQPVQGLPQEDVSEYVAHLQLHMTLQARKLVPTLTKAVDSREQLLQQTQADFEKLVSRQMRW